MEKMRTKVICGLVVFGAFLLLVPSIGLGQITVNCPGDSLQSAISSTASGTILVNGICNENISIGWERFGLILDGGGTATINGLNPNPNSSAAVLVISKGVTIRGFNITGNLYGIRVLRGGNALIDGNTIQSGSYGIFVASNSYATIINNTIQNNPTAGVEVNENSYAQIGVIGVSDTVAQPNHIQSNATGVIVTGSSSARIVGNTISSNAGDGVRVSRVSQADIANNTIDGNGQNGIFVTENSGVNLGKDTGPTIYDSPNFTTVNNGGLGLKCTIGGYADGRLGTLNGAAPNPTSFMSNCTNSLFPLPAGPYGVGWGGDPSDTPAPGDYNGDGKTDIAIFREGTGVWYVIPSGGGTPYGVSWGGVPGDKPVFGDYNGDGITDIAVYRASTGVWYIIPSSPGP